MTPTQLAHARHNAYRLLSQLLLHGFTPALLPQVMAVAELANAQPVPFDPDEAAADHQQLFGFNLFPYESVFRHPSGLLGGPVTEAVAQTYRQYPFSPPAAAAPDHIGVQLAFLAFLCAASASGAETDSPQAQTAQRHFLQTRLLPWLPPLVVSLRRQPLPFYQAVGDLLLELAADHACALGIETAPGDDGVAAPPPPLLADDKTSLRDIARFLLTPSYSGLWLSREDISCLARQRDLPRGFGEREQMLLNVLRAAAQYDALVLFLTDLHRYREGWQAAYQELTVHYPTLASFIAPWQARCDNAGTLLSQIATHPACRTGC